MYLQDPTGGQGLRSGLPLTCVAGTRGYPRPVVFLLLFLQDTLSCTPSFDPLLHSSLLTIHLAWGEHVGGLTHLPRVDPEKKPT